MDGGTLPHSGFVAATQILTQILIKLLRDRRWAPPGRQAKGPNDDHPFAPGKADNRPHAHQLCGFLDHFAINPQATGLGEISRFGPSFTQPGKPQPFIDTQRRLRSRQCRTFRSAKAAKGEFLTSVAIP